MLDAMLTKIINNGNDVYIQYRSILGFPTYRIYIPGISELVKIDENRLEFLFYGRKKIKQVLLNIYNHDEVAIKECIDLLIKKSSGLVANTCFSFEKWEYIYKDLDLIIFLDSIFRNLSYELLIAILCLYLQDLNNSKKWFSIYIEKYKESPNVIITCLYKIIEGRLDNINFNKIIKNLSKSYDNQHIDKAIKYFEKPSYLFKDFQFPQCSNCNLCPIKRECFYDEWKIIVESINSFKKNNVF